MAVELHQIMVKRNIPLVKLLLLCISPCIIVLESLAAPTRTAHYLARLDDAIANRDRYLAVKEQRIDSIKACLMSSADFESEYVQCQQLIDEYLNYSLDSALVYAKRAMEVARHSGNDILQADAYMVIAHIYNSTGLMTKEAHAMFVHLDRSHLDIDRDVLVKYYVLALQIYHNLANLAFDANIHIRYKSMAQAYRDSVLQVFPDNEIILANKYIEEGNYEMARQVVSSGLNDWVLTRDAAARYHVLARIYGLQNNTELRKVYLAQAACCDMVNGVREYMALQELAQMLYDEGNIDRAYRYIHQSIADAIACNARSRMLEMSKSLPIIDADYNRRQAATNFKLYIACAFIGVLSVLLFVVAIYVHKRNRRWKKLNVKLQQTNRIKEEYITQFINMCSEYLSKMESYRNNLQKIAALRNFDKLYNAIQSGRQLKQDISDFYETFDKAFLHLFPTFVSDFNKLLRPECRIMLKEGERLNTELRIFALLRLGVHDSKRVTEFLRCSYSTIYNYRSKMRSRALCPDDFEKQVMDIS